MEFSLLINMKMLAFPYLLAKKFSCTVMFGNNEFAIASNLRFISRKNFMLSLVEHEKSFIVLRPGQT